MLIQPQVSNSKASFNSSNKGYWRIGQVLTIGKIVTHKGECVQSLELEPQGIAQLVSKEVLALPDDVCAFAHVLTRKCNDGLLTLGIGVVDPGWENHISSPILNFSSERRLLQVGEQFIRLTFHRVAFEPPDEAGLGRSYSANFAKEDYLRDLRARAVGNFGKSFLNIRKLVGKTSKEENQRIREALLKYVPIGAFSLAFFALLVTSGVAVVTGWVRGGASVVASATDQRVLDLERRLSDLERVSVQNSHDLRSRASRVVDQNPGDALKGE